MRSRSCELRRVLVGVDAHDPAAGAAAFAGRLAKDTGAQLTVVYVRHIPAGYSGPPIVTAAQLEAYYERVEARVRARVDRALAPLGVASSADSCHWAHRPIRLVTLARCSGLRPARHCLPDAHKGQPGGERRPP